MLRLRNLNERFGTPASASSFLAAVLFAAASFPKQAIFARSASLIANGPFGRMSPPTSFTMVVLERASPPPQRSTASVSARRTRGSSKGFLVEFGTTSFTQIHG